MVGFSLWHIHPEFALVGILGSLALAWLLIAIPYQLPVAAILSLGIG
jgi:hypothetical protein